MNVAVMAKYLIQTKITIFTTANFVLEHKHDTYVLNSVIAAG
jgi:hypothetical protein